MASPFRSGILLAIGAGGAVGAIMRYWVSVRVYDWLGQGFPYGTLAVNVLGSLVMGLLYVILTERLSLAVEWRAVLMIGFLGSFTTFSTFSLETLTLFEQGNQLKALTNVFVSMLLCLAGGWTGIVLGRQL